MTIMFEVEDLAVASPATVSRCGMVFLEPSLLGYDVIVKSYLNSIKDLLGKNYEWVTNSFILYSDAISAFCHKSGKFPVPTDNMFLVMSMMNMFDSMLMREYKIEDAKLPKEFDEMIPNVMLFSLIWSFGGALDDSVREKYDNFLQELILGDDVNTKYELDLIPQNHEEGQPLPWEPKKLNVKLGEFKSLFDLYYDKEKLVWLNWIKTIPPYVVPKDVEYTALIVPTIDSIIICKIMNILAQNDKHSLFCGPTGTGKTISIAQELRGGFDPEEYTSISLSFSAQTGAN